MISPAYCDDDQMRAFSLTEQFFFNIRNMFCDFSGDVSVEDSFAAMPRTTKFCRLELLRGDNSAYG